MFTGIIESMGKVIDLKRESENLILTIESEISGELNINQSVSHNGVCLSVIGTNGGSYTVEAVAETLDKSNLNDLKLNDLVNLERSLKMDARLDGHFVQGHVDTTAKCVDRKEAEGSIVLRFELVNGENSNLIIGKGSVAINGVSLTVADESANQFSVAIIPLTLEKTNLQHLQPGGKVNIEFDMIGKHIEKILSDKK